MGVLMLEYGNKCLLIFLQFEKFEKCTTKYTGHDNELIEFEHVNKDKFEATRSISSLLV